MREIKNNVEIGKIQKADLKTEKIEKAELNFCGDSEGLNVKDFSNPSEVLGRAQVNSSNNLKSDISFCSAHPGTVLNSDKLFEMAFNQLKEAGDPNAYEKACAIATSDDARALL